ncbi:hypothetical protein RTBOTA2_005043 [Rhodotorula toruloides]|nr:hypothetical protein RTBOTA2_005043 [Rhodotorula toruloides]
MRYNPSPTRPALHPLSLHRNGPKSSSSSNGLKADDGAVLAGSGAVDVARFGAAKTGELVVCGQSKPGERRADKRAEPTGPADECAKSMRDLMGGSTARDDGVTEGEVPAPTGEGSDEPGKDETVPERAARTAAARLGGEGTDDVRACAALTSGNAKALAPGLSDKPARGRSSPRSCEGERRWASVTPGARLRGGRSCAAPSPTTPAAVDTSDEVAHGAKGECGGGLRGEVVADDGAARAGEKAFARRDRTLGETAAAPTSTPFASPADSSFATFSWLDLLDTPISSTSSPSPCQSAGDVTPTPARKVGESGTTNKPSSSSSSSSMWKSWLGIKLVWCGVIGLNGPSSAGDSAPPASNPESRYCIGRASARPGLLALIPGELSPTEPERAERGGGEWSCAPGARPSKSKGRKWAGRSSSPMPPFAARCCKRCSRKLECGRACDVPFGAAGKDVGQPDEASASVELALP